MSHSTATIPELTAEQVSRVLIQPLATASKFLASGPTVFDTAGPLRIPVAPRFDLDALDDETPPAPLVDWTAEGGEIPEATAEAGEVKLLPSTMKSIKVITRFTNELARQSVVPLESALRSALVAEVAGKLDRQLFSADGDGVETPKGMFAWSGVGSHDAAGPLTVDALLTAHGIALGANVNPGALRVFMRSADWTSLRALKDSDQRYLLAPDPTAGAPLSVLGMPVVISDHIPEGYAAVADMSKVAVARDMAPSVTVLRERYADTDESALRVVCRYDAAPLDPAGIVTITGITATTDDD